MEQTSTSETPLKVLHLEITCSGENRLKTSLSSQISIYQDTLRPYEEAHVSLQDITHRSQQMLTTLNQANRHGRLSAKLLQSLKETGQLLRDELLTPRLKEKLNTSDARYMAISIDEQLVHIPWELLHDGHQFLCQRFTVGRLVQTRQNLTSPRACRKQGPLHVLILADLDGSLPAARKEGVQVRDFIESLASDVRVMMCTANVGAAFLRSKIRSYDWVHFAGHADYDADPPQKKGWRLSNGWFTAEDAARMAGTGAMPKLIFANACQSARTNAWSLDHNRQRKHFGLVNALLLAGTRHYVGTSWEIPDEPGRSFSLAFYDNLMQGATVGHAVGKARKKLIDTYGEKQVIWASYVLYGDPTHRYMTRRMAEEYSLRREPISNHRSAPIITATRASDSMEQQATLSPHKKHRKRVAILSLCALVGALLIAVMVSHRPPKAGDDRQQQAMAAFRTGDFEQVLEICPPPSTQSPPSVGCLLLRANVIFVKGDLEEAGTLYELARESSQATKMESAEALIGLGRIASTRDQHQQAMAHYQQAAHAAPRKREPFVALAIVNERLGKDQEAIALLETAEKLAPPGDFAIRAMRRSLSAKVALDSDKERLAHIDRLIDELTHTTQAALPSPNVDRQGPRLMPVWVMVMESSGYCLQEGAPQLITVMIENHLQERPSFRIVDRHFMDKTLLELKLGTSPLVDQQTRLKLGRLLAVRLMVNGRIVFSGPETQVTLRCIDTETSGVVAVVVAAFENGLPLSEMARRVTDQLIKKIDQVYS